MQMSASNGLLLFFFLLFVLSDAIGCLRLVFVVLAFALLVPFFSSNKGTPL
jgi:hypothetical protein